MIAGRRTFIFERIHLFNFPLVLCLRVFGEVYTARLDWPGRLTWLAKALQYTDTDLWHRAMDRSIGAMQVASAGLRPLATVSLQSGSCDISDQVFQRRIIELERTFLYLGLAEGLLDSTNGRVTLLPPRSFFQCRQLFKANALDSRLRVSFLSRLGLFFDFAEHLVRFEVRALLRGFKFFLRSLTAVKTETAFGNVDVVIRGISAIELASGEAELDFSWWVKLGLVDPARAVFILPGPPTSEVAAWLEKMRIRWLTEGQIFTEIPTLTLLSLMARLVREFAVYVFAGISQPEQSFRVRAECLYWEKAFQRLTPKLLINSLSESWPQGGDLSAARLRGIKTANWAYAGSSFGFGRGTDSFGDRAAWRSLVAEDEAWVWSEEVVRMLSHRQVEGGRGPRIHAMGPMMAGDARWLGRPASDVRRVRGIGSKPGFYVGIFDIPMYAKSVLQKEGLGPYTTLGTQEGLYHATLRLLREFPEVCVVIKTKRKLSADFEVPPSMAELLNDKELVRSGRLILLGPKTDPYIPIAAVDFCVSTPFSSPVMVAEQMGKPGVYLDVERTAEMTFENAYQNLLCFTEDELIVKVRSATERKERDLNLETNVAVRGEKVCRDMVTRLTSRIDYMVKGQN